ncbi:hypothetical protein BT93_C1641 [Corymbia citriodora subsp. variegata]|nr:hypothetical protein BT93_C1641 [Corymbia citriodora subsp. variegata]
MANPEARTSSDVAAGGEYQVFLSFRGSDTRHGFTDCLYHALVGAGIHVFRDDDELRVGEVIGGELLRAIDDSILYIPIFSQSYATSKWCLRELARIVENTDASSRSEGIKKKILPIFLGVEPDDVKLKTSLYRGALLEHEKKVPDEVEAWRKALLQLIPILTGKGWNLPGAIGILENLEEIHAERCEELEGEIPSEVGNLLLLRILNLSDTRIDTVPSTISMLPRLQKLDLSRCHEIKELPKLPASLICLRVESRSLMSIPNLSNLTNLEELLLSDGSRLSDGFRYTNGSDLMQTSDLPWIGRLSKLNKLELRLWNNPAPSTELSSLSLLKELTLSSLDLQPLEQLPSSLLELRLNNFNTIRSLSSNLRNLLILVLCGSRVKEIQLHGHPQLRNLTVERCELLERLFILSSLKSLIEIRVCKCSELVDIQFHGVMESLQYLSI